jgi:hypothetical protein
MRKTSALAMTQSSRQAHAALQMFDACPATTRRYSFGMSTVPDIESAVQKLSRSELAAFRDWFFGFDAAAWDKQFDEDVAAGRLDALADEAIRDSRAGRCTEL